MNLLELFKPINTFVFETDGVLAGDIVAINETGNRLHYLNSKDIYALQTALAKGYKIWFVTTGKDEWLNDWRNAGADIINGRDNADILAAINDNGNTLYIGADMPALMPMQACSLSACPANAIPEIKQVAKYISPFPGGNGCIRDVVEKVLKLNGDW